MLIRNGWETIASPNTSITPGYELSTWILKQVSTPALHMAEVAAFTVCDGYIQVVGDGMNKEISNVKSSKLQKKLLTSLINIYYPETFYSHHIRRNYF